MTMVDFAETFTRLKATGRSEETAQCAGVAVRLVRVAGGREDQWGHHTHTAETIVVWSGDFSVELSDSVIHLTPGQCCVVPVNAEHRGTSKAGAEVILFQNT
jgi:mannose-6-phosphate isomerase-like protein (cupin superfamily)